MYIINNILIIYIIIKYKVIIFMYDINNVSNLINKNCRREKDFPNK